MFSRIAIVNRGEAAMRLIHAVRDLNAQAGPDGGRIATVALHTEGERRAMFGREADHAYDLGPAANRPYLDYAGLARGTYFLRASILDANGKPVITSQQTTFHVRQPSINSPQSPQAPPKPKPPKPAPKPTPKPAGG